MARVKTKTEEIKETENEEVIKIEITDVKPEHTKSKIVIAKAPVPFRRKPNLEHKYVTGQMPVGVAYEITKEVTSIVYGDFYLLNNGSYITKNGNYSIS